MHLSPNRIRVCHVLEPGVPPTAAPLLSYPPGNMDNMHAPITDLAAFRAGKPPLIREALDALAELITGMGPDEPPTETAERFTQRHLGVASDGLLRETRYLGGVRRVCVGLVVDNLIDEHRPEIGPDGWDPPSWTAVDIGGLRRHPERLRAAFPPGTLLPEATVVLSVDLRGGHGDPSCLTAHVRRDDRDAAAAMLDELIEQADARNPYRGRVSRATLHRGGLALEIVDLPSTLTRDTVILPAETWAEVDLAVRAVRYQHETLNAAGLGCRRGLLLAGPPGVGKSALAGVVAGELVPEFTVLLVDSKAGESLLTSLVTEAQRLQPALLVLDDLDLWVGPRHGNSRGLSELLSGMEIEPESRILVLATTNDASGLDAAAIRTGRFDGIITVDFPDRIACAAILTALLRGLPCAGALVDTAAVAASLPDRTSGSDLREIVRRAVLSDSVTTGGLVAEVGAGRYRPEVPVGAYL